MEGSLDSRARVLLIEDLVNKGTSTISAALALRDIGMNVDTCMSLFTYGFKATRERFAKNNLALISVSDLESLLMTGVENGVITPEEREIVQHWSLNPDDWSTNQSSGV